MSSRVSHRHPMAASPRRKYPIEADLEYEAIDGVVVAGRGRTKEMSSSEVVFKAESPIPAGLTIRINMDWPVFAENVTPLRLYISGMTVRTESGYAACKFGRHEFRIAPEL